MKKQKILVFDIETAPMLAYIWQAKTEYVSDVAINHETFMLTWAAKWLDGKKIYSEQLYSEEAIAQSDTRIVAGLADMIGDADKVIAHNGSRFDIPMMNNRLLLADLFPLGRVEVIDTLLLARRSFRLASNKLDYLARILGVGEKLPTSFELWKRAYNGDEKALTQMQRYNKNDVVILERVYNRMLPWTVGAPRTLDAEYDMEEGCPRCGSADIQHRGYARTQSGTFPKFVCKACNRWSRSRKSLSRTANLPI